MGLWHNARLLALLANTLIMAAVLGLLAATLSWVIAQPYFELHHVQLGAAPGSALRHVNKPGLVESVQKAPSGNFFTVDMNGIKAAVKEVPWVRNATVRRLWPDTLVVMLEEHRAAALWEDSRLVNVYGELFTANLDEAVEDGPLPQLGGPDGSELEVLRRYQEIQTLVEPLGVPVVAVNLSARLAWTVKMDDGTELLVGKNIGVPIADRISRWVESYPLVTERMQRQASVIDLRYPNGYAVRSLALLSDPGGLDSLVDLAIEEDNHAAVVKTDLSAASAIGAGLAARKSTARKSSQRKSVTRSASKPKKASTKSRERVAKVAKVAKAKPSSTKKKAKKSRVVKKSVAARSASTKPKRSVKRVVQKRPAKAPAKDTRSLAEIRRDATRKAARRYVARTREAAKARRAVAAGKRSDAGLLAPIFATLTTSIVQSDDFEAVTNIQIQSAVAA